MSEAFVVCWYRRAGGRALPGNAWRDRTLAGRFCSGFQQEEFGEIGAIVPTVTREEAVCLDLGVGADEKIAEQMLSCLDGGATMLADELLGTTTGRTRDPSPPPLHMVGPRLPGSRQHGWFR